MIRRQTLSKYFTEGGDSNSQSVIDLQFEFFSCYHELFIEGSFVCFGRSKLLKQCLLISGEGSSGRFPDLSDQLEFFDVGTSQSLYI